jgi:hypothetical protein
VGGRRLFQRPLDEERTCVLVLIGATEDGTKELLAVVDDYRESTHPGVKCLDSSNAWVSQRRRSSRSAMDRWVSGSLWRKNMAQSPGTLLGA